MFKGKFDFYECINSFFNEKIVYEKIICHQNKIVCIIEKTVSFSQIEKLFSIKMIY